MTGTGNPSEDVLDSADREPVRRSRRTLAIVAPLVAGLLLIAGLFGLAALEPDPAPDQTEPAATSATSAANPSLVDASARRLYGELAPMGAKNFSTAVSAANAVVGTYCRGDVPSWAASLITSANGYDTATFLMSPANRRFGSFIVQVELRWTVDHFSYAVVAGQVERCA